jgi:hypothetical protein
MLGRKYISLDSQFCEVMLLIQKFKRDTATGWKSWPGGLSRFGRADPWDAGDTTMER